MISAAVSPRRGRVPAAGLALVAMLGCANEILPDLATDPLPLVFNDTALVPLGGTIDGAPCFSRRPVFEAIPGRQGSHAAAVTAFADGELLAAWYSYDGPHELAGSAIFTSRRLPGESDWTRPRLHADRPEGDGNPVLYSEGDRVYLFQAVVPGGWSTAHIVLQVSDDRGHSWSEPRRLPGPLGANVRFPPVRTPGGWLLLPAYDDLLPRALFYASPDGTSWSLLGAVSASPRGIQPSVAVLQDGRLVAVMRSTTGGFLWVTTSRDGGRTWTPPQDSGFPNPASAAAVTTLANGDLLMIFNDSRTERTALTAALSRDGGRTWPYRRVLSDPGEACSYPAVVQTRDGLVHTLFSVDRRRIDHVTCSEAWIAGGQRRR